MHPMTPWERLGISEDEWRVCQLSAAEVSIARGSNVTPYEVALEYVLARAADTESRPRARA